MTKPCRGCGKPVVRTASICQTCGTHNPYPLGAISGTILTLIVLAIVVFIVGVGLELG